MIIYNNLKATKCNIEKHGAPGAIRTPDPLIRSQILYPAELRVHIKMVPLARLELARPEGQQILSLSRLPIPPQRQYEYRRISIIRTYYNQNFLNMRI